MPIWGGAFTGTLLMTGLRQTRKRAVAIPVVWRVRCRILLSL